MTVFINKTILVTLLCLGLVAHVQARSTFPPPPKSIIGMLGNKMIVNGIPMQIRQFSTNRSLHQVIAFYKTLWEDDTDQGLPGYSISTALPPWTIISRIEAEYLLTVQVTSDNKRRASGYLSMSPLDPEQITQTGQGFPRMKGSMILNDTVSEDSGKKGRNVLLQNSKTIKSNANFYRNHYRRLGWEEITEIPPHSGKQQVLQFRRSNKHVTLVLKEQAGATIVTSQSVTEGSF
jgi:hypothetical protein